MVQEYGLCCSRITHISELKKYPRGEDHCSGRVLTISATRCLSRLVYSSTPAPELDRRRFLETSPALLESGGMGSSPGYGGRGCFPAFEVNPCCWTSESEPIPS